MTIKNKFKIVEKLLRSELFDKSTTLLDIGCRDCVFKTYIGDSVNYFGLDLYQNPQGTVDYVANLSQGLPFDDKRFDYVVALDVIEHLDDFYAGLLEVLRVSKKGMIILLPNTAYIHLRLNFLLKGRISSKFDLNYPGDEDRHRWLTTIPQMDDYMKQFAKQHQLALTTTHISSLSKKRLAKALNLLGLKPTWWIWASVYLLKR